MLKLIFTCTDDDESEGQRCCHTSPRFIVWKALIEWKTICIFAMAWNSMSSKSDKNAFNGEQFTTLSRHILSATRPKTFLRTLERTLLPCTCELQSFKFSQSIPKATSQENYLPLLLFICSNKVQIKQEIKTIYAEMVWNRLRASVLQYAVSQTRMGHGIYVRGMAHEVNQIIVITRRCRRMFAYAMYGPVWIVCQ